MSADLEIVLTEDEATLLARAAGKRGMPGVKSQPSGAAWTTAMRALVERGLVTSTVQPEPTEIVRPLLDAVLVPERSLWLVVYLTPKDGPSFGQSLWFRGDEVVRHSESPDGRVLARTSASAISDLLALGLDFPVHPTSETAAPTTIQDEDLLAAMLLGNREGAAAAGARYPAAAQYVEANEDSDRFTQFEIQHHHNDELESYDGREMTLISSPLHGLWLTSGASSALGPVVIQRVSDELAREKITAFVHAVEAR